MKIQRICCKAFYSKFKYCCRILLILISLVSDRLTSCKSTHAEWNSFLFNFESETRSLSNIRKSIKVWQHIDYMNYSYWYLMNKRILIENEAMDEIFKLFTSFIFACVYCTYRCRVHILIVRVYCFFYWFRPLSSHSRRTKRIITVNWLIDQCIRT